MDHTYRSPDVVNVLIDFAMERRDENQLRAYLRRIHRGAS